MGIFATVTGALPIELSNSTEDDNLKYYQETEDLNIKLLENVNWTTLDIKAMVDDFPLLENLFVENSNISSVIPPDENNHIKVNIIFDRVSRNLILFRCFYY